MCSTCMPIYNPSPLPVLRSPFAVTFTNLNLVLKPSTYCPPGIWVFSNPGLLCPVFLPFYISPPSCTVSMALSRPPILTQAFREAVFVKIQVADQWQELHWIPPLLFPFLTPPPNSYLSSSVSSETHKYSSRREKESSLPSEHIGLCPRKDFNPQFLH